MWIDVLTAVLMAGMMAALGFVAGCDWARCLSEDEEAEEDGGADEEADMG